jgi:hypothetical protein
METCDNFVINLACKQIFSSSSVASSFLGQHNAQDDDRQHHHDDDQQPAKPLTRVLLVWARLNDLLVGRFRIDHHISHVRISSHQFLALFLGVLVDLGRNCVDVIH